VNEDDLRKAAASMGEGVTLERVEAVSDDEYSGYLAVYTFEDINDIRVNQNPGGMVPSGDDEETPEEIIEFDYRNRNLTIRFPVELDDPAASDGSGSGTASQEDIEMIKQLYSALKIGIYVVAEDGIARSDASFQDGDTVTLMEMDFSKILEDEEAFAELIQNEPETIEEMKDLIQTVPGIKVETKESISIRLK
jgi:hypothetical protein